MVQKIGLFALLHIELLGLRFVWSANKTKKSLLAYAFDRLHLATTDPLQVDGEDEYMVEDVICKQTNNSIVTAS
jgi:hypothetical protein